MKVARLTHRCLCEPMTGEGFPVVTYASQLDYASLDSPPSGERCTLSMNAFEPSRSSNLISLLVDIEEPPEPCQRGIRSKEETHPRPRIRPDRVSVAKWIDEPKTKL